jgi:hypothetical protein
MTFGGLLIGIFGSFFSIGRCPILSIFALSGLCCYFSTETSGGLILQKAVLWANF